MSAGPSWWTCWSNAPTKIAQDEKNATQCWAALSVKGLACKWFDLLLMQVKGGYSCSKNRIGCFFSVCTFVFTACKRELGKLCTSASVSLHSVVLRQVWLISKEMVGNSWDTWKAFFFFFLGGGNFRINPVKRYEVNSNGMTVLFIPFDGKDSWH